MKKLLCKGKFYAILDKDSKIKVFDTETDEEYLPYYIKDFNGEIVNEIRKELKEFLDKKNNSTNKKDFIIEYIREKYNIEGENPFKKGVDALVFKKSKKWFGIITNYNKGLLINLKNKPEVIENIIDNINILPAYHMNKKHWISLKIENNLDVEEIKKLIDESYNLV